MDVDFVLLDNICKGKSKTQGGANVPQIIEILKGYGIVPKILRADLNTQICDLIEQLKRSTGLRSDPLTERAKRQEAERAKREATERAKRQEAERAKREATERAKRQEAERAKREATEKAKRQEQERAKRQEAERAKRQEAERAKRQEAERAKRQEAERAKRQEAERAKRQEEERAKRQEEERAKRQEEERVAKQEAERAKRQEEERARLQTVRGKADHLASQPRGQGQQRVIVGRPSEEIIREINGKTIPVANLICATKHKEGRQLCTPLGANIANSLIRVASERIFSNPAQSIMELPVNSIDSYAKQQGKPSVGKFGMGFYSVLYWLVGHPTRNITIGTWDNNLERNIVVKLGFTDNVLHAEFTVKPPKSQQKRTIVELSAGLDPIPEPLLRSMEIEIRRLASVTTANIVIDRYTVPRYGRPALEKIKINRFVDGRPEVKIILGGSLISVSDRGEGMTLDTILNALLIPSSSTKTIALSATGASGAADPDADAGTDESGLLNSNYTGGNRLDITVNNIIVRTIIINFNGAGEHYLLTMPSTSRLPVGRDDLIFTEGSPDADIFIKRFLGLMKSIKSRPEHNFIPLLSLLDEYVMRSNQIELYRAQNMIYAWLNSENMVFVPKTDEKIWKSLTTTYGINLYYHPNPQLYLLEKQLMQLLAERSENVFQGKVVIPVDGIGSYSTAGFSQIIFVDKKFMADDWINNIMVSSRTILKPYVGLDTTTMDTYILELYDVTFKRLLFNGVPISLFTNLVKVFSDNYSADESLDYKRHIAGKMSQIIFDFSYGSTPRAQVKRDYIIATFNSIPLGIVHNWSQEVKSMVRQMFYFIVDMWDTCTNGTWYSIIGIEALQILNWQDEDVEFISTRYLSIAEAYMFLYTKRAVMAPNEYVLRELRQRASPSQIQKIISDYLKDMADGQRSLLRIVNPVVTSCRIYYDMMANRMPIESHNMPTWAYTFTAKSLISYVFNEQVNDKTWLADLTQYYKTFVDTDVRLQVIEIAVNEGTTKDYIWSVLNEITQNAFDEIRSSGTADRSISYYTSDIISVTDNVGIPHDRADVFLALMIPFLSTKSSDDPNVTGEMGSGFFYIYRQPWCNYVRIVTTRDGVTTELTGVPMMDRSGQRVLDILYTVDQQKTVLKNGTTVELHLHKDRADLAAEAMTNVSLFVRNYAVNMDADIYLNKAQIAMPKTLIAEFKYGSVYNIDPTQISVVMTNGVPYQSLDVFLSQVPLINNYTKFKKHSVFGMVIDLNKKYFKPVQSRNSINMTISSGEFDAFIYNCIFRCLCYRYSNGLVERPDEFIVHSTSKNNVHQLFISIGSINSNGFLAQYPEDGNPSLGSIINQCIRNNIMPDKSNHLMSVASKWFEGKDLKKEVNRSKVVVSQDEFKIAATRPVPEQVPEKTTAATATATAAAAKKEPAQTMVAAVPYPALQKIVNAYWSVLLRLISDDIIIISGVIIVEPPTIYAVNITKTCAGYYDPADHSISLNHQPEKMESVSAAIERLISSPNLSVAVKTLREDPVLNDIMASEAPIPALIHELLHAIRKERHDKVDSHNNYTVTIDEIEQTHCFDYAALAIYKSILSRGLLQELRGTR